MGRLGPTEMLVFVLPVIVFTLGYFIGKSRGYNKGFKEGLDYKNKN